MCRRVDQGLLPVRVKNFKGSIFNLTYHKILPNSLKYFLKKLIMNGCTIVITKHYSRNVGNAPTL